MDEPGLTHSRWEAAQGSLKVGSCAAGRRSRPDNVRALQRVCGVPRARILMLYASASSVNSLVAAARPRRLNWRNPSTSLKSPAPARRSPSAGGRARPPPACAPGPPSPRGPHHPVPARPSGSAGPSADNARPSDTWHTSRRHRDTPAALPSARPRGWGRASAGRPALKHSPCPDLDLLVGSSGVLSARAAPADRLKAGISPPAAAHARRSGRVGCGVIPLDACPFCAWYAVKLTPRPVPP